MPAGTLSWAGCLPPWDARTRRSQSFSRRSGCGRSEEHTSELQPLRHLVCRLLLEKTLRSARSRAGRLIRPHVSVAGAHPPSARCSARRAAGTLAAACSGRPEFALNLFFNDTATPEIYPLSLHDALPI